VTITSTTRRARSTSSRHWRAHSAIRARADDTGQRWRTLVQAARCGERDAVCEDGFLPEALINYLARLGWSHGDVEIFSMPQFIEWFDLRPYQQIGGAVRSGKLRWLNQHYIKLADNTRLAGLVRRHLQSAVWQVSDAPQLEAVIALYKEAHGDLARTGG